MTTEVSSTQQPEQTGAEVQAVQQAPVQEQIPANHIDLEAPDTQKLLDDAYNSALGREVQKVDVSSAPDKVTVHEEKKVTEPTEEPKDEVKAATTAPAKDSDTKEVLPGIPDWAKDLPKDIQEKVLGIAHEAQYHQQRWRSDIGRQSALQAKLTEARRELANLRAAQQRVSQVPQGNPAATAQKGDAQQTPQALAEWNQIIEADPNLAKAIESRIQAEVTQAKAELKGQIDANVDPLYQHTMQAFVDEQQKLLREAVPNVDEVLQSPVYRYWITNVAAPGIRQLAETSTDYADAVNVLRMYANDAPGVFDYLVRSGHIQAPPNIQVQANAQPAQQVQSTQTTTLADKVAKVREQKVHAAPVVPTAPVAAPTTSMATTLASSKPGQQVDLEDAYVQRALEEAYNRYKRN